jgi:hypothetical protein
VTSNVEQQSPTSNITPSGLLFGIRPLDLIVTSTTAGQLITTNGIIIREPIVCDSASLPIYFDLPWSVPDSSVTEMPVLSSLFHIKVILAAFAADMAIQLKRVLNISFLPPPIFFVRGAKALFSPKAIPIDEATAPVYPLATSAFV